MVDLKNASVRIRAYQVDFGDCFLVSFADGNAQRHMLVDFGNVVGMGGKNAPFAAIAANIAKETAGQLDVAVVTHEHIDHMEGFYHQRKVFDGMQVGEVWMSLPSAPDYYEKYKKAEPLKKLRAAATAYAKRLRASHVELSPGFDALLRNNLSNVDRIDYLRSLGQRAPRYLARGSSVKAALGRATIDILAPEKDMSVYYGQKKQFAGMARAFTAASAANGGDSRDPWTFPNVKRVPRPAILAPSEWERLRTTIQEGGVEAIRTIDRALNNTSLVFLLTVNGKRLLFPGDAELESWETLAEKSKKHLKPLDFLKVSHHGSHNGTPTDGLLDKLLPKNRKKQAVVLVSTKEKVYGTKNPVPDAPLLEELGTRCKKLYTTNGLNKPWIDVFV